MKSKYLIIGGGIAGLSAANHIAAAGEEVTVLEEGSYPAHKICGEFISPEVVPLLEKWNLPPSKLVSNIKLISEGGTFTIPLTHPAGAQDRFTLDDGLAKRAIKLGTTIKTRTTVATVKLPKSSSDPYVVTLANGEEILSPTLIITTNRLLAEKLKLPPPQFSYVGLKAHFAEMACENTLKMYLLGGAYFGSVDVGKNRTNIAGIIRTPHQEALNPKAALASFLKKNENKFLHEVISKGRWLFDDFMTCPVPEFGLRTPPKWPNCYFVGDAMGVIPPATGNGIAMGLTSGLLAARHALLGQQEDYRSNWQKEYGSRISRGRLLQHIFLSRGFSLALPTICRLFPTIPRLFFQKTRGTFK